MRNIKLLLIAVFGKVFTRAICRGAHYVEHAGFVLLAGAETFSLHAAVVYISAILLVSGIFALVYDKLDNV